MALAVFGPPYGLPHWPLQSPETPNFRGFQRARRSEPPNIGIFAPFACPNRGLGAGIRPAAFYRLLCMFNGFALAKPFCRRIKVNLMGVGT
jgi:hypothetical protein